MVQLSKDVSQRVAFQTVRDRVRGQLDAAADDPDLPGVFDYLITCGVGKNSYLDDLLDFGAIFVDSRNGNCVSPHSRLPTQWTRGLLGRGSQS